MEATIVNFRRGKRTQKMNQMVITYPNSSREAGEKLIGKTVSWKSSAGKEIKGTVSALHGNGGNVRARFEKGMPGQAIGTKVTIQ